VEYIGLAAIAGCYLAIIGLYVWVFRQIQEVKNEMNKHKQNHKVHISSDQLVFKDVCDEKVRRFEEKMDNLKETMENGFTDLKEFFKGK